MVRVLTVLLGSDSPSAGRVIEEIAPRFIVLFDVEIEFVRQIEVSSDCDAFLFQFICHRCLVITFSVFTDQKSTVLTSSRRRCCLGH